MKIVLTNHARKRLLERKIDLSDIREAIKNPFASLPTVNKKRKRVMAKIGSKTLDVIYAKKSRNIVIITAAWLSSEDRKTCQ